MRALLAVHTGTVFDACWYHTEAVVPAGEDDVDDYRRHQILALARYGRFGGGNIHQWDDEPVEELNTWYRALVKLMDRESAMQATTENS